MWTRLGPINYLSTTRLWLVPVGYLLVYLLGVRGIPPQSRTAHAEFWEPRPCQ